MTRGGIRLTSTLRIDPCRFSCYHLRDAEEQPMGLPAAEVSPNGTGAAHFEML